MLQSKRRWSGLFGLIALLTLAHAGRGQTKESPTQGDQMIDAYLAAETAKVSKRFLDGATSLAEWTQRRPRLHREYLDMLGLWPLPEKTPLHATVTGTLQRDRFVVDKLHFQSRPGLYVTGNLYRPRKVTGKLPAVLYVCGHSHMGRDGNKTAYQDHGKWFAANGYICLVIDTLQLGEVPGVHHGTYNRGRWWWQARGYTPAGVECWNGIRAIDYLVSRPDVDARRIVVTGISGGGAATFWIAAADERVTCAVPVSGMSDLESYVTHKVINGHCDCMFLVNTYGWQWTTIAALIAPRPLLFANSDKDSIFPMDGNRRIIARLRKIYGMYGKPELVNDYVSHGGHAYRPDLRVAVFQWINKHVKHDTGPVKDVDFKPIAGKELRVFPEDKDIPKDQVNATIDETFVPRARPTRPEEGKFAEWKQTLLKKLREKPFRTFPERIPSATFAQAGVQTEPHIHLMIGSSDIKGNEHGKVASLFIKTSDADAKGLAELAKQYGREGPILEVDLRGGPPFAWTQKSPPNYVARAHALLGRTVDQGRVWDVAAIVRLAAKMQTRNHPWRVVGRGPTGVVAAYAALFEPSIKEVVIVDPPTSHREGPIFLNVLRLLDIPEALGLLAPRRLMLINAKDKAFDRTTQIYKLAGAEDKLSRK